MLTTAPVFFILLFGLFAVGSLFLRILKLDYGPYNQATSILTGTVFFALVGEWCAYLSLNIIMFVSIVVSLVSLAIFLLSRQQQTKEWLNSFHIFGNKKARDFREVGIPAALSILYMILAEGNWSTGQIFYRTGPDTFGWSDAINFFRSGHSLTQLKNLIIPQLNGTPLYSALGAVHQAGSIAWRSGPLSHDKRLPLV